MTRRRHCRTLRLLGRAAWDALWPAGVVLIIALAIIAVAAGLVKLYVGQGP